MKRFLALLATAALAVTVVLPAALFAELEVFAPEQSATAAQQHDDMLLSAQSLAVGDGDAAPALRDQFGVEIIKPAEAATAYFPPIAGLLTTWPCSAQVNDGYGPRDGGFHYGIDIMCAHGTPLVAAAPGVVEVVEGSDGGWGWYVKINHGNGISTLYSHMVAGSPTVMVGQVVAAGEVIGATGDTGNTTAPHCHFEVWVGSERVDPRPWLP